MRHLFDDWEIACARMAGAHLLVLLDFDGTLAPIAPTPDEAALPSATRCSLARLAASPRCTVAVVSGRAIDDLRAKVGLAGVAYVGSHGLESADAPALPVYDPPRPVRELLARLKERLGARLAAVPGSLLEEKKASLAVHYRRVDPSEVARVEEAVRGGVAELDSGGALDVAPGKMVLEIRPRVEWNKGTAVERLIRAEERRRSGAVFPLYVGDDATDEDGFRALAGRGLSVLVGERPDSSASHFVADTEEVARMLRALAERCGEPPDR